MWILKLKRVEKEGKCDGQMPALCPAIACQCYSQQTQAEDPDTLFNIIAEFQPALSRGKIQKNWRKIVGIYLTHAEKAMVTGMSEYLMGVFFSR